MKKCIWFIVLISCLLCGCIRKDRTSDSQLMDSRDVDSTEENENVKEDVAEQWEKGYDLPIDEPERKEAEDECKMILELISDIYAQADKGEAANTVLDDKTIYKMQNIKKSKIFLKTVRKRKLVRLCFTSCIQMVALAEINLFLMERTCI